MICISKWVLSYFNIIWKLYWFLIIPMAKSFISWFYGIKNFFHEHCNLAYITCPHFITFWKIWMFQLQIQNLNFLAWKNTLWNVLLGIQNFDRKWTILACKYPKLNEIQIYIEKKWDANSLLQTVGAVHLIGAKGIGNFFMTMMWNFFSLKGQIY